LAILVIPARYGSKRLPGKPLLEETGRPLVMHVLDVAARASLVTRALVATDDPRIRDAVRDAGGEALMTSADHTCGTERVAEVAEAIPGDEPVVNLQGDEPEIEPADIDLAIRALAESGAPIATLAAPIASPEEFRDPAVVKVVTDAEGNALYFSRAPIPHDRDGDGPARARHHLGVYAFTREALRDFASRPPSPLERTEKLEQLRALEAGTRIRVALVDRAPPGIDTMEAYREFVRRQAAGGPLSRTEDKD
jgi:3-deoxy-manno-octulosonate cytidylyltransferase (CMP-KDO synthetase)